MCLSALFSNTFFIFIEHSKPRMRKLQIDPSLATYSDEDLIGLMHSENDGRYAGELFKRYTHLVYGVCVKYLKDQVRSKDVVMDIFEIFLKKPPTTDILSFKKWLFTITKNQCLTVIRNTKRANRIEVQTEDVEKKSEIFMENEDVGSLNSRAADEAALDKALKQLKVPQFQCIRLFYLEGKSYKEIEQSTDFNLKQIKSYLQNGKRKLKLLLERQ